MPQFADFAFGCGERDDLGMRIVGSSSRLAIDLRSNSRTNDEIQRTMEFIVKQKESFAESMEQAEVRMNLASSCW